MRGGACCVRHLATYLITITGCACIIADCFGLSNAKNLAATANVFKADDFIVVINTEQARLELALASRPLRAGLRTFIAIDNATLAQELNKFGLDHNETYAYFPNRKLTGPERSKPGDTRWQAAPFLAHHHYGPTYKWMLLGDDDTLWFMLGVKRLLHDYIPDLPYAISDHLGDHNARGFFVPSPLAAVCSPCHWLDLVRSHHREQLLTQQQTITWNPRELDGWGFAAGMRIRRRRNAGATTAATANGTNPAAADGATQRTVAKRLVHRLGTAVIDSSGTDAAITAPYPVWGKRGQEHINMTEVLRAAYYSTDSWLSTEVRVSSDGVGANATAPRQLQLPPLVPPPGCPCRPAQGCLHRARLCHGRGRGQELCSRTLVFKIGFRGNGSVCRHSWAHGGAGVVLSVGLMRATAGGPVEACARATQVHSCDMNLAMCLMNPALGLGSSSAGPGAGSGAGANAESSDVASKGSGAGTFAGSSAHADAPRGRLVEAAADLSNGSTAARRHVLTLERPVASGGHVAAGDWEGGVGSWGGNGSAGSDRVVGGGLMFTHPGSAALHGANWADPRFILFDNPVYQGVLHDPVGFLEGRVACGREARDRAVARVAALAVGARPQADDDEEEERELEAVGVGAERGVGRRLHVAALADSGLATTEWDSGSVRSREEAVDRGFVASVGLRSGNRPVLGLGKGFPSVRHPVEHRGRDLLRGLQRHESSMGEFAPLAAVRAVKRQVNDSKQMRGGVRRREQSKSGGSGDWPLDGDLDLEDDSAICAWFVRHAVSLHMHGRSYPSYKDAAKAITAAVRRHLLAVRRLRAMAYQEEQL